MGVVFAGAVQVKAMWVRSDPSAATVLDGSPGAPRASVVDHARARHVSGYGRRRARCRGGLTPGIPLNLNRE
jgi:hypothetical protein